MCEPIMRHSYVQVNDSFVHLLQYGQDRSCLVDAPSSDKTTSTGNSTSNLDFKSNISAGNETVTRRKFASSRLMIFVPGNPGVLGIYHDFLFALFQTINSPFSRDAHKQATILAIGHNNFDHPDHVDYKTEERVCIEENELNFVEKALAKKYISDPHHIDLQVLNKLIIIKRLLKTQSRSFRLTFVGHSIGCYIILKLLQDKSIASIHDGSVMIHPALENMALTAKGSFFERFFHYRLELVLKSVAYVVDKLLPRSAKLTVTKWFCSPEFLKDASVIALESLSQLCCQKTLTATIQMAKSEFALVKDINIESMIKPQMSKLKLIYAINDRWVNTDNRKILRDSCPELYMEEQSTLHAFVMDPQTVMDYAVKVGMFIQDFIDNSCPSSEPDETGYGSNNES